MNIVFVIVLLFAGVICLHGALNNVNPLSSSFALGWCFALAFAMIIMIVVG